MVESDTGRLLLDCGPGVLARLRETEAWPSLEAIAITHFHLDHWGDLVPWVWGSFYRRGHDDVRPELWVYRGGTTFLEELGSRIGFPDMFEKTFQERNRARLRVGEDVRPAVEEGREPVCATATRRIGPRAPRLPFRIARGSRRACSRPRARPSPKSPWSYAACTSAATVSSTVAPLLRDRSRPAQVRDERLADARYWPVKRRARCTWPRLSALVRRPTRGLELAVELEIRLRDAHRLSAAPRARRAGACAPRRSRTRRARACGTRPAGTRDARARSRASPTPATSASAVSRHIRSNVYARYVASSTDAPMTITPWLTRMTPSASPTCVGEPLAGVRVEHLTLVLVDERNRAVEHARGLVRDLGEPPHRREQGRVVRVVVHDHAGVGPRAGGCPCAGRSPGSRPTGRRAPRRRRSRGTRSDARTSSHHLPHGRRPQVAGAHRRRT